MHEIASRVPEGMAGNAEEISRVGHTAKLLGCSDYLNVTIVADRGMKEYLKA
jgi:hypothetical protein